MRGNSQKYKKKETPMNKLSNWKNYNHQSEEWCFV